MVPKDLTAMSPKFVTGARAKGGSTAALGAKPGGMGCEKEGDIRPGISMCTS
jgi:hypothetical protein